MLNLKKISDLGLTQIEKYYFDSDHYSYVFEKNQVCIIVDSNICINTNQCIFDYSKYCEMQNKYMSKYDKLYRFNYVGDNIFLKIEQWLMKSPDSIEIEDLGGWFDSSHTDNTPLEKTFEELFMEAYGDNATEFLKKEYAVSLNKGTNAFVDYVVETKNGNFAIEENGVKYHHPCLIGNVAYERQLEKQNTLNLYNFKVYRFSTQNLSFKEQTIDNIKKYLGNRNNFINSVVIKEDRKFKLYEHQEKILEEIQKSREEGINTSLIVIPTGTGKSQIVIEDMINLAEQDKIKTALIMVPSIQVKEDWLRRLEPLKGKIDLYVKFYNNVFVERNSQEKDFYDYIVFDEAHHAQAANCKKTLQYFTPKYLIGLTATPERLDKKKLDEIFGQFETKLTLREAIEKKVISNIRCYRLISNIDLSQVRYNGKDYNYADLEKTLIIDSRNELIVETVKKYFMPSKNFFKQGIVFCVNVEHAKKLETMFNEKGISARAVYGSNKDNNEIIEKYKNKEIQFLLSCQIISEGWDCPQTEIVIMARPTLSKVLYLQQIGRGVRNHPGKECLYVIDVVDNYVGKLTPWNFNSLFKIPNYSDFMGVINNNMDYLSILGLSEKEITMQEIDIFTFEEKYKDYKSLEQTARELFVGTNTLAKWVKLNPEFSSLSLPIGSKMMPYFSIQDIAKIKEVKKIQEHNETTILKDFIDFIDENTLTYSFKLIFILGMFRNADKEGEVNVDKLLDFYISFYKDRLERNLQVDRKGCVYTFEYLDDRTKVKKSLLDNPFEKFERKRFVYFSKDLNVISFNPSLWEQLTKEIIDKVVEKEQKFLEEYYKNMGGI